MVMLENSLAMLENSLAMLENSSAMLENSSLAMLEDNSMVIAESCCERCLNNLKLMLKKYLFFNSLINSNKILFLSIPIYFNIFILTLKECQNVQNSHQLDFNTYMDTCLYGFTNTLV